MAHYNGAGLMALRSLQPGWRVARASRRIWGDVHKDPDYTRDADPDGETLQETRTVDALGRIVTRTYPDGAWPA